MTPLGAVTSGVRFPKARDRAALWQRLVPSSGGAVCVDVPDAVRPASAFLEGGGDGLRDTPALRVREAGSSGRSWWPWGGRRNVGLGTGGVPAAGGVPTLRPGWEGAVSEAIGSVPCEWFEAPVDQPAELVQVMTGCQFALGDIALETAPPRSHGGDMTLGEDEPGVEGALRAFAETIGLSFPIIRTYRWVAARRPEDHRREGVSFVVHRILASAPDAYEIVKSPPVNKRTDRSQWSGDTAKRAAGWSTVTPVPVEEKGGAIRDLAARPHRSGCADRRRPGTAGCGREHGAVRGRALKPRQWRRLRAWAVLRVRRRAVSHGWSGAGQDNPCPTRQGQAATSRRPRHGRPRTAPAHPRAAGTGRAREKNKPAAGAGDPVYPNRPCPTPG